MGTEWRCTGCGSASDEQHPADCPEYLKSLGRTYVEPDELPDLGVELRRLEALVQAYQAMPTDAERRRAMNYLRDRFPGPTVMRGGAVGGSIVVNEEGRRRD